MNRWLRLLTLLVVALILLKSSRLPAAASPGQRMALAEIDAYVQAEMRSGSIPGLAYAIVDKGQVVHAAAFGSAGPDGRPLTTATPMLIGSVGKTITALAVRQLAAAGLIEMTAPVQRYLPWFELATPGAAAQITLQNLLDHESGISKFDGQNLARFYVPGLTAEEVVRSLADVPINRPVGSSYEYSNLNYTILGVVVEAVSGLPYADYVQARIFAPLGMQHSYLSYPQAEANGLAQGYRYLFGLPIPFVEPYPTGMVPAGYHISCVEDMARYLAALSNGGQLDGSSVVSPAEEARPVYDIHWQPLSQVAPGFSPAHSGTTLNFNAALEYVAADRVGVVVMLNANPQQLLDLPKGAWNITNDVLRLYLGIPNLLPRSPNVGRAYLFVDAALLVLAVALALHLRALPGWVRRMRSTPHRLGLLAPALLADGLLPLAVLIGVPLLMQAAGSAPAVEGWTVLLRMLPDIGWSLLVLCGVLLIAGGVRLAAWLKSGR